MSATTDSTLKVGGQIKEEINSQPSFFGTALSGTAIESLPPEIKKLIDKVNSGTWGQVAGAFGDIENCEGIVEQIIEPIEGGRFTKFFGCDFLFKGYPVREIVEGIGFYKSFLSLIPRKIFSSSRFWKTAFLLRYIFLRKYFWHDLHIFFFSVYANIVQKVSPPKNKFNRPVKAIGEAIDKALSRCIDYERSNEYKIDLRHGDMHVINRKREIWETVALLAEFVYLFLEYDNAYRFRLQDTLESSKKASISGFGIVREINRLFLILIAREDKFYGIAHKWRELRKVIVPILIIDRRLRKFARIFFEELNIGQIALDEHDWYFCLKRRSYDFRGESFDDRIAKRKEIDKAHNHRYYRLLQLNQPDGTTKKGIQVMPLWET